MVERIQKKEESTPAVMMRTSRCHTGAGVCQAVAKVGTVRTPRTIVRIVRIVRVGRIININPSFCRRASHIPNKFLVGGTPCQPNSASGHSASHFSLADETLS